jgi:hypothetical protein
MAMRRTVLAVLMCAVFVTVFAAPLVQSEDGEVHTIDKFENGPPSTCAKYWIFSPSVDGTWTGEVVNYGMRWIIIDIVDEDTGEILVDRDMYRFAVYGNDFSTDPVGMTGGHNYRITVTPNGPLYTEVTVQDTYEGNEIPNEPPVADFTFSVDGLAVSVDASLSDDPDGTIVSYLWEWGDGTTSTGMTATHTYEDPGDRAAGSGPGLEDTPIPPWNVVGMCFDESMVPMAGCVVTVTNVDTGLSAVVISSANGLYECDMNPLGTDDEDVIHVEAVSGDYYGENEGVADKDSIFPFLPLDIVLVYEEPPPEPFDVLIKLTVTDDDGATATIEKWVTVNL